jgi:hypothetical protein
MGGEPTIHPQFPEICALYARYLPRKHRGLWTAGGKKYEQYKDLIDTTFGIINFNDHFYPSYHQPIMVAIEEIVHNEPLRKKIINNCWLQRTWSPTITPRGAFFCEVAATFDLLFDGPGGYPLEPGWWKKGPKEMQDQVDRYCRFCSVAVPMETHPDTLPFEYVSHENAERLRKAGSPLATNGTLRIDENEYTKSDYIRIKNSKSYREPARYAEKDLGHFWIRNSILFQQKWGSIPYKIKSILNDLSIRYLK